MFTSPVINDYIAGAIGGSAGLLVGFPFDTTKVQLQTQRGVAAYTGTWDALKSIHTHGWVQGFFRGLSWPLISYGVINSIFFGTFGMVQKHLNGGDLSKKLTYSQTYFCGAAGGVAQLSIAIPIDVIKVVLQSQIPHDVKNVVSHKLHFSGPLEATIAIYRKRGIRGLYRGASIQAIRDIPSSGLYFLGYEYFNDHIYARFPSIPIWAVNFLSGGTAGTLSWISIIHFDVIKSRVQADHDRTLYKTWMHCARDCYKQEGLAVFFKGMSVMCVRAFPVNAVIFMVYSHTLRELNTIGGCT